MFHALLCLEMIRDDLQYKTRHHTNDEITIRSAGNGESDHDRQGHVNHCLAYIAQVSYSQMGFEYQSPILSLFGHSKSEVHSFKLQYLFSIHKVECCLLS